MVQITTKIVEKDKKLSFEELYVGKKYTRK